MGAGVLRGGGTTETRLGLLETATATTATATATATGAAPLGLTAAATTAAAGVPGGGGAPAVAVAHGGGLAGKSERGEREARETGVRKENYVRSTS